MYDESVDWTDWTWELMLLVALLERVLSLNFFCIVWFFFWQMKQPHGLVCMNVVSGNIEKMTLLIDDIIDAFLLNHTLT